MAKKKAETEDHVVGEVPTRVNTADDKPYEGGFAAMVSGDHSGRYGVYVLHSTEFDSDGHPHMFALQTRDEHNETLHVSYADAKRAEAGQR